MSETMKERNTRISEDLVQAKADLAKAEASGDGRKLRRAKREIERLTYELFSLNLPLVYRYAGRFKDGAEEDEYEAEGKLALLEAITSWEPDRGSLGTHAYPRIKKAILTKVAAQGRLKTHAFLSRQQILEAEKDLRSTLKREPTDEEIATKAGIAESLVRHIRLNEASGKTRSLNQVVGPEGTELGHIAGPTVASAEEQLFEVATDHGTLSDLEPVKLADLVSGCDIWEIVVGLRHLGADDGPPQDFQEMAPLFGVSRETLRKDYKSFSKKIS